jgi:hypothetical protein
MKDPNAARSRAYWLGFPLSATHHKALKSGGRSIIEYLTQFHRAPTSLLA